MINKSKNDKLVVRKEALISIPGSLLPSSFNKKPEEVKNPVSADEFYYNSKVILTVFKNYLKRSTGHKFTSITKVKNTLLVSFQKTSAQSLELFLIDPSLIELKAKFKGKSVQVVEAPGTIIRGNKQEELVNNIILLFDQHYLSA